MSSQRADRTSLGLLGAISMGVGWALFILLYGIESFALGTAGRPWPFERPFSYDGGPVLAVLGIVCLLSSFMIMGFVEVWTRYETPARWLRWSCSALASIPLLGLYVVSFWGWVAEAKPPWAFTEPGHQPTRNQPFNGALRFSRGFFLRISNEFGFSVLVVHTIALQALFVWLLSPDWPNDIRSQAVTAIRFGLRTIGFIATFVPNLLFYRWGRISHRWFPLALLCCVAWLAPWPFYALALASGLWGLDRQKKHLLSTIAYASRSRISQRLERGGGMDWWKSSLWQRWRFDWLASRTRTTEARLIRLYRVKTFLLILDAGALVLALGRLAQDGSLLAAGMAWAARWAAHLSLPVPDAAVLLLPVLLLLVARSAETLRTPTAPDPLLPWRYLLLVLGAVLIGSHQGVLLLAGDHPGLAVSLLYVGFVGSTSIFCLSMPFHLKSAPRSDTLSSIAPWIILFLSMDLAGRLIVEDEDLAAGILRVLELCALLSPAWALAAGLVWGRSLIEPFHPRDLLSRRFAAGPRAMLAFLILASALPFGGLATPLWRPLRSRLLRVSLNAGRA